MHMIAFAVIMRTGSTPDGGLCFPKLHRDATSTSFENVYYININAGEMTERARHTPTKCSHMRSL